MAKTPYIFKIDDYTTATSTTAKLYMLLKTGKKVDLYDLSIKFKKEWKIGMWHRIYRLNTLLKAAATDYGSPVTLVIHRKGDEKQFPNGYLQLVGLKSDASKSSKPAKSGKTAKSKKTKRVAEEAAA